MRVLLLNQYFHPDLSAVAQIATDLAEDLAASGVEVTALASQGTYLGGGRLPAEEVHRGIRIVRMASTSFGKGTLAGRLSDYASYYAAAALKTVVQCRPDVIIAASTPPLLASIGAALKWARRIPFVFWVQDVYPELAVEFGLLRERSIPTQALDAVSRAVLRSADVAVVLGEEMASRIASKGVPRERIQLIPNWADTESLRPMPHAQNAFRAAHGLEGKRVVLYSGNMGRGHDMRTVLGMAEALREERDLVFLFIGAGAKREEIEARSRDLPNVRLLPYQPRERLSESLSAGDVHLVTQDANMSGLLEPSKLYGILAAGRPTLYVGPAASEVARTIVQERVGEVVANGDVAGAVEALRRLFKDGEALGRRARSAAETTYDRRHRTRAFGELLSGLVEGPASRYTPARRAPG